MKEDAILPMARASLGAIIADVGAEVASVDVAG
jgi:hypothetical protein